MKKVILGISILLISLHSFSQYMTVKKANLSFFHHDKKRVTRTLEENSSSSAKHHPEYGVLPYNSQCYECVELIDKRTLNSRQFVDPNNAKHTYSQSSYFPLHYKKNPSDIWRSIDFRLHESSTKGIYIAENQPVPTKLDVNKRSTSLTERGFEFEFNKNLTMYFFDEGVAYSKHETGNYNESSVGEEGMLVKNIWSGINMEQVFKTGEIETNYIITAPLQVPISKGWMVIEDHFSLPAGFRVEESREGKKGTDGMFKGDYLIKDDTGETRIVYPKPVFVDAKAWGMHGTYRLLKNGNDYTVQMFIPVSWLNNPDNTYPLTIDPNPYGATKDGDFRSTGLPSASMGFTTMSLGFCPYHMTVTVPGGNKLTNAYVDVEYQLTYDNTCGNPPLQAPFCTFSQATEEVQCDICNTTTGLLSCNPALPPFTGTCTTDSALVPGAHALLINNFVPNYLNCIAPQCPDYLIAFTLKNRDSICGDQCGYLCARGNMWRMTVEACPISGNITQDLTQVCAGQPVTFTAHPSCGVPPYHYVWSPDGGNTLDTVYGSAVYVVHPQGNVIVGCTIIDTCGDAYITNDLNITVVPAPPANAGSDVYVCEGGIVTLGGTLGNPTTSNGASVVWSGSSPTVENWLNNKFSPNPQAIIPAGTVDSFFYVVKASDFSCFRTDTVWVHSLAKPTAIIDSSGATHFCANQSVTLLVQGTYAAYQWNTGSAAIAITASQPGQYFAIVTDTHGCKDTSNVITVTNVAVPTVHVFPDTLILFGDSVMLYTDINLASASVDSFTWFPSVNISCTSCTNPFAAPLLDQYYGVIVHSSGCTVSDSALIRVILPNNFYIPNAFTPNGDGNNDNFYLQSQSGVRVILFQVFDRWGEKVHEGNYPWDGNYRGKPVPGGVYVYIFKLGLYGEDRALFRKGSVTLIR